MARLGIELVQLKALTDNYVYLIREEKSGKVAVVDPTDADLVMEFLGASGWSLHFILNTHHHFDHVGGNLKLKKAFKDLKIVGPKADQSRIPGIDIALSQGDILAFGQATAEFIDTPGHTKGHGAFYFKDEKLLFCGDTLFSLGCGRLFEGTPEQMWGSLRKLRALPDDTRVCCAHEYTEANARFAVSIDPDNQALARYTQKVKTLRKKGQSTIPSLLSDEKKCNPFLRADDPALQKQLAMKQGDAVRVFAEIRSRKDNFR
jgi:hydroxyacylglutathione hydrolase